MNLRHLILAVLILATSINNNVNAQALQNHTANDELLKIADEVFSNGYILFKKGINLDPNTLFDKHRDAFELSDGVEMILMEKHKQFQADAYHYKYQMHVGEMPVRNGIFTLHEYSGVLVSGNGRIPKIDNDLSTGGLISESAALNIALVEIGSDSYFWEVEANVNFIKSLDSNQTGFPKGCQLALLVDEKYVPIWKFTIATSNPFNIYDVSINALTGKLISKKNQEAYGVDALTNYYGVQTINTSIDPLSGTVNLLRANRDFIDEAGNVTDNVSIITVFGNRSYDDQPAPGNDVTTSTPENLHNIYDGGNTWTDIGWENQFESEDASSITLSGTINSRIALDVHWAAEMTFEYLMKRHGRNSYDGVGGAIAMSAMDFGTIDNARWVGIVDGFGFGNIGIQGIGSVLNPLGSIDMVGHEIGHGIFGSGDSGQESIQVAEGLCDILGTMVEFYALEDQGQANWQWADLVTETGFINPQTLEPIAGFRNLEDPSRLNQPTTGTFSVSGPGLPELDVSFMDGDPNLLNVYTGFSGADHIGGALLGHWFYILSEGKNGINAKGQEYAVNGIGKNLAASVLFETIFSSYAFIYNNDEEYTYQEIKEGTILFTKDYYGLCSEITQEVIKSWYAIGLIDNLPGHTSFGLGATGATLETGICSSVFAGSTSSLQQGFDVLISPGQGTAVGNGIDQANTYIYGIACSNSATTVEPNSFAVFEAGNTIFLKPGFHAKTGANFVARIDYCVSTSYKNLEEDGHSGNEENDVKSDATPLLVVYPNPTEDILNIRIDDNQSFNYCIHNAQGVIVSSGRLNGVANKINVSNLVAGLYIFKANFADTTISSKWLKN
jgi:Zn-dependent metalloprotease